MRICLQAGGLLEDKRKEGKILDHMKKTAHRFWLHICEHQKHLFNMASAVICIHFKCKQFDFMKTLHCIPLCNWKSEF